MILCYIKLVHMFAWRLQKRKTSNGSIVDDCPPSKKSKGDGESTNGDSLSDVPHVKDRPSTALGVSHRGS